MPTTLTKPYLSPTFHNLLQKFLNLPTHVFSHPKYTPLIQSQDSTKLKFPPKKNPKIGSCSSGSFTRGFCICSAILEKHLYIKLHTNGTRIVSAGLLATQVSHQNLPLGVVVVDSLWVFRNILMHVNRHWKKRLVHRFSYVSDKRSKQQVPYMNFEKLLHTFLANQIKPLNAKIHAY